MSRLLPLIAIAGCCPNPAPTHPDNAVANAHPIDEATLDRSVRPGDDFFEFANGGWLKATEIPPDRAAYGTGAIVAENTAVHVRELLEQAGAAPAGSEARKVGDYYATFMDEAAIEAKGAQPLAPTLARIAAIANETDLARELGSELRTDVDILNNGIYDTPNLFGLWIAQDLDDPNRYSPFLVQGGLSLPDREYYLDDSQRMKDIREAQVKHVAALLTLAKIADADAVAARVVALEKVIATAQVPRTDIDDAKKGNNHWTREQLIARAPGLDWATYLAAAGLGNQRDFVVWQPPAVTALAALVHAQPLATWREYLVVHAIERAAPLLSSAFVDESFAFNGKVLSGTPKLRDRWKRGVDQTSYALGEAVGKLYVAKYFPPSEKARAEGIVKNLIAAFATRIDRLEWMSPATKAKAKAKLAALRVYVGYPDTWRDYSQLEVVRGDALGNFDRAELFELRRNVAKLGKPVDRGEWAMTPHVVNAVNLPAMNVLNFPAGMLQPPFFDPNRPAVMDYGAMGAVIGHEISHSFDNSGSAFDATGRLADWWTPEDRTHFEASTQKLIDQYNQYKPFDDLAVNGRLTLGENVADSAGLAVAFDGYRLAYGGKQAPTVQGFTGDQQFFISFATAWRTKYREPALRRQVLTNGHAPSMYRAATVRNNDAWYDAFDVKPGEKLYLAPADRVHVW